MTPESWKRIASLFEAANDLAPTERRAFLERECGGDASLLVQVLDLLEHDRAADGEGFLDDAQRPRKPTRADVRLESRPEHPARHVTVVLGLESGLVQTDDFGGLLRERMHVSAWIVLFGFLAFFVKNVVDRNYLEGGNRASCALRRLAHVDTGDRSAPQPSDLVTSTVARLEWALTGVIACFFTLYQIGEFRITEWSSIATDSGHGDVLNLTADSGMLRWFAFLVGYGLVIPNTWWRCARVVLYIALLPVAVILGVGYSEGTLGNSWTG